MSASAPTPEQDRPLAPWLVVLLALPIAAVILWPIFARPWWENHDMYAYPVRLIEYVQSVRLGNLFPRWCPDLYGGYGEPLFNFYPPGVLTVATPFALLGASPALALKLSLFVYTTIGLCSVALLVEACTARRDAAILALGLFALAPYRYVQVFIRGDLAEYCAIAVVPLALLGYVRLRQRGVSVGRGAFAAAAHAAVLLNHTITGQWFTELMGIVVLVWVAADLRKGARDQAAPLLVTFGGALGLTAMYTLPAFFERDLVRTVNLTLNNFTIDKNFLGELKWALVPGFFFAGYPLIVLLPCSLVAIAAVKPARLRVLPWALVSAVLLALMNPESLPVWKLLPLAKYIGFPWRLLGFLAVSTSVLGGVLWSLAVVRRSRATDAALLLVLLALVGRARSETIIPNTVPEASIPHNAQEVADKIYSTVVADEYLPRTATAVPKYPRRGLVFGSSSGVAVERVERSGVGAHLIIGASEPGTIDLAQFWFPGWVPKQLSGPSALTLGPSPEGYIRVTVPTAGHYELRVRFAMTPLHVVATLISLLTLGLVPWLLLVLSRRRRQ